MRYPKLCLAGIFCLMMFLSFGAPMDVNASTLQGLQNGSFEDGMSHWTINPALDPWDPLVDIGTNKYVSLHPPGQFNGMLFYQDISIGGVGGNNYTTSLKLQKISAPAGNTVAVYLDYIDAENATQQVKVLNPSNDDIGFGEWGVVSGTYQLPSDAVMLTKLSVFKEGFGEIYADDICLAQGSYTITALSPDIRVVQGQIARLAVKVDFLDGFTTSGGISFSVPEDTGGITSFAPVPLQCAGGTELSINTATLPAGTYNWSIKSSEANSSDKYTTFTLKVVTVTDMTLGSSSITANQQGKMNIFVSGICSDGLELSSGAYTLASENPDVFGVYPEIWEMSGYAFYAQESGVTSLTATCVDGFTKSVPVSITIPAYPKILSVFTSPSIVNNSGLDLINVSVTSNAPLSSVSWNIPYQGWLEGEFYDGNTYYAGYGYLQPGCEPGVYLMKSNWGETFPYRVGALTVVDDPANGQIKGRKYLMEQGGMQHFDGSLEIYDMAGNLVKTWNRFSMDNSIYGYSITPGTYRVRYATYGGVRPQWYPNANSFETAGDVVVIAGEAVENINFFLEFGPPEVNYTDPWDGASNVPLEQVIYAGFSTSMDVSTINEDTVKVEDASHAAVSGTVTTYGWDATFTPDVPLSAGMTYTVTITTGAKSEGGRPLESDYVWSFTTVAAESSIADLKTKQNGDPVSVSDKVLYYVQGNFGYIQEPDKPIGIRIEGPSVAPLDVAEGKLVSIMGTMATTASGERFIQLGTLDPGEDGEPKTLGANNKSIKTEMMGGLYVRAWGKVLSVGSDSYVISDGTDADGILVHTYETPTVTPEAVVVVSGAAGWESSRVIHAHN